MGSRCWACGEKFGRCYEHGGLCDCDVHTRPQDRPGRDDSARTDAGATVDLAGLRAATVTAPGHDPAVEDWGAAIRTGPADVRVGPGSFYNLTTRKWARFDEMSPYLRALIVRAINPCIATATVTDDGDQA